MKVAVIGKSAKSLQVVDFFRNLQAQVLYFPNAHPSPISSEQVPEGAIPHQVLRVQKSFLRGDEQVPDRSRMADTFRVVYALDPEKSLQDWKDSKLPEEALASLKTSLEAYQEVDIVIDTRPYAGHGFLHGAAPAVGELTAGPGGVFYGPQTAQEGWLQVALVGSGTAFSKQLGLLSDWLFEDDKRFIHLVDTHQKIDWTGVEKLKSRCDSWFQERQDEFQVKLKEWQELDDFVKVKVPKPREPQAKLVDWSSHSVVSVDKLIDRPQYFLSIERPHFSAPQQQNPSCQTLAVDAIISLVDHCSEDLAPSLLLVGETGPLFAREPGFYRLLPESELQEQLAAITDDVMRFFRKV
jgi:hypothetical protein